MFDGMPPRPQNVLVLCCARTSAWDVSVHAREMEWSPTRIFQVNARGIREQSGWEGEWGCNLCGRTILHDDALAMAASIAHAPEAICPVDGPRTLVVDLAHSSTNWICLPGCTQRLPDDDASDALRGEVPRRPGNVSNYFASVPPASNRDSTNSFVYCLYCYMLQVFWKQTQAVDGALRFCGLNLFA